MKKLADFILSGYGQAAFSVAGLAWFASFIPLVGILSSAALTLVTLRWGGQRAGIVLALSTLLLLVFFAVASFAGFQLANYQLVLLFVLLQWVPVIAIAHLLRRTASLSFTLNMIVIASVSLILLSALLVPERAELWDNFFSGLLRESSRDMSTSSSVFAQEYRAFLEVMTGVALTSLVSIWTMSLLLARWWENLSGMPGGFRAEFTGLKLGESHGRFGNCPVRGRIRYAFTLDERTAHGGGLCFIPARNRDGSLFAEHVEQCKCLVVRFLRNIGIVSFHTASARRGERAGCA